MYIKQYYRFVLARKIEKTTHIKKIQFNLKQRIYELIINLIHKTRKLQLIHNIVYAINCSYDSLITIVCFLCNYTCFILYANLLYGFVRCKKLYFSYVNLK